ncbi:MAG TPA: DUF6157 family protein [Acidimicrobiales bacterium]
MEAVDYTDTFIACSDDCPALVGIVPPGEESVAARTWRMIAGQPYSYTSGDVIFEVYADRRGIPTRQRASARREFYSRPRACLRSSDLAKRYGWGIHADADGRLAVIPKESPEYATLIEGRDHRSRGIAVKVVKAMRSSRK